MDQNTKLIMLYDYYSKLLTDKQCEYFEYYYFDNLSLSEISENMSVSRNAVHKQIKEAEDKLLYFEDNLKLFKKRTLILKLLNNVSENIKEEIKKLI